MTNDSDLFAAKHLVVIQFTLRSIKLSAFSYSASGLEQVCHLQS